MDQERCAIRKPYQRMFVLLTEQLQKNVETASPLEPKKQRKSKAFTSTQGRGKLKYSI